jgi:hypothetical protein
MKIEQGKDTEYWTYPLFPPSIVIIAGLLAPLHLRL